MCEHAIAQTMASYLWCKAKLSYAIARVPKVRVYHAALYPKNGQACLDASVLRWYLQGRRLLHDGGISILSYHSIDEHETDLSVSPRLFEEHMAILAKEHCPTLTMNEVAAHITQGRPFPPRAVAITFDDGFASIATFAAPIMARYGMKGTVYIITGMVGRTTQWRAFGRQLPPLPFMTWPKIQELSTFGWQIGAHSVHHGFLTQCSPADLNRELRDSKAVIEDMIGAQVRDFAYPQGDYNASVVAATRATGYTSAVTIDQGRAGTKADLLILPRLFVGRNTSPAVFRAFTVPLIGPTYRLINWVIRDLRGQHSWPTPQPAGCG